MSNQKIKYQLEFPIQASPSLLYQYISNPSGLSEWFADNVNSRGRIFTFMWEESEEQAKLLTKKNEERIKLQWLDDEDTNAHFELRIQVDDITKDVSLIITDFADDEDGVESGKMLWESMIEDLKQLLGSS
ncbi:MAG TPA: START-like domain-containing protein [Flavobacteriaceae bacterium]|nr:START-like domain-containing protein [Flavobacteriaceae bacterium]